MLVICALSLVAGLMFKGRCSNPESNAFRDLCYNDIQALYGVREIDGRVFPYVHGTLRDGELANGAIEYPVLTGVFMWGAGLFAEDYRTYLQATAILLTPFGLLAAYLLGRMSGRRALLYAAAPAITLYAFHNWDLLVVAATVGGLWAWSRGRHLGAAALFGVGAALKMYPALFLLPLALHRLRAGDRRGALLTLGAGAGTFVAINLPFAIANFDGWWATYEFHRARLPNFDTVWLLGLHPNGDSFSAEALNLLTTGLILVSFVAALVYGWRRSVRRNEDYPFLQVCGAALVAFLLWNKVHSPQYTLWLLPFFVVVRAHIGWWIAYSVADLAVYVGIFRWFYDFGLSGDFEETSPSKWLLMGGIWARALLLAALFVVFLRARSGLRDGPDHTNVSHPSPSVRPVGTEPVPS